jgi:hypothetical protein
MNRGRPATCETASFETCRAPSAFGSQRGAGPRRNVNFLTGIALWASSLASPQQPMGHVFYGVCSPKNFRPLPPVRDSATRFHPRQVGHRPGHIFFNVSTIRSSWAGWRGRARKVDGVVRGGGWTSKRVIAERSGLDYHEPYVGQAFKKLGFSHMSGPDLWTIAVSSAN